MLNKSIKFTGERASLTDMGGINLARYKFALKFCKNRKVLELGCGSGYGAHYIALNGASKIIAYDADKRAVDFANANFNNKVLEYRCGNVEEVKLSKKVDVAIALEIIEHLKKPGVLINLAKRSLNKKGLLIISTPNKILSSYDGKKPSNPYHTIEYSPEEFSELLKSHFRKVDLFGIFLKNKKKEEEERVQRNWRWKISSYISKKRWIRKLVNYLPEKPKRIFTGEKDLMFKHSDFRFSSSKVEEASYLIAVCTL